MPFCPHFNSSRSALLKKRPSSIPSIRKEDRYPFLSPLPAASPSRVIPPPHTCVLPKCKANVTRLCNTLRFQVSFANCFSHSRLIRAFALIRPSFSRCVIRPLLAIAPRSFPSFLFICFVIRSHSQLLFVSFPLHSCPLSLIRLPFAHCFFHSRHLSLFFPLFLAFAPHSHIVFLRSGLIGVFFLLLSFIPFTLLICYFYCSVNRRRLEPKLFASSDVLA
jgi:hypothetical protein